MSDKKIINIIFIVAILGYFLISSFFLLTRDAAGDELYFLSDLNYIRTKGWYLAIEKNFIKIYCMILFLELSSKLPLKTKIRNI